MREATREDYLGRQLIAYIGSKRRLLQRISPVFSSLLEEAGLSSVPRFLDPFCGSGAVARLARTLGMAVRASDAEPYAAALAEAFIARGRAEVEEDFRPIGGLEGVLASLNAMHPSRGGPQGGGEGLLARLYAPARTEGADWRKERLFYTRENALFLDRVRAAIDELRPSGSGTGAARAVLLGLLLYEAATHANTSGVFKAFHKGFGGHGGDALKRILGAAELEYPVIVDGPPAQARIAEARDAVASGSADIVYLDPPYNQHQYGSNYHLLNAILRNEPEAQPGLSLAGDGSLREKAGIDPSWRERRSPWCVREAAPGALSSLIEAIDAPFIVMSYGDSGIMDPRLVQEILSTRGRVEAIAWPYTAFRGGRQSEARVASSSEILFILRTGESRGRSAEASELEAALARARLSASTGRLLKADARSRISGGRLCLDGGAAFQCDWPFVESLEADFVGTDWPASERDASSLLCFSMEEEAEICLAALEEGRAGSRLIERRFLRSLRKLAHPRYKEAFARLALRAQAVLGERALEETDKLLEQAKRRLEAAPLRKA